MCKYNDKKGNNMVGLQHGLTSLANDFSLVVQYYNSFICYDFEHLLDHLGLVCMLTLALLSCMPSLTLISYASTLFEQAF